MNLPPEAMVSGLWATRSRILLLASGTTSMHCITRTLIAGFNLSACLLDRESTFLILGSTRRFSNRAGHMMVRREMLAIAARHGATIISLATPPSHGTAKRLRPIKMPMQFALAPCIISDLMRTNRRIPRIRPLASSRLAEPCRWSFKLLEMYLYRHPHRRLRRAQPLRQRLHQLRRR